MVPQYPVFYLVYTDVHMSLFDWLILTASLVSMVLYGMWRGRGLRTMDSYFLANRRMKWATIALSIMATQASAITFLSTPGQAFVDGMRFVQFYLGLPIAMIILCAIAVPIYHRLKVTTAYEYLEKRFDLKTRLLAAGLFLLQRGLAAGFTIYAPAIIFSVLLGWDIRFIVVLIGGLVVLYTAFGGTRSVNYTHVQQMIIIFIGMISAFFIMLRLLPETVSFRGALEVAGAVGRLKTIDFSFDLNNRYTFWSGLFGGLFVALSYFGTDQSQVQRYLTGKSITEIRMGLLFNGMIKVPMQFFILFIGIMVFVFYHFSPQPIFFNPVLVDKTLDSPYGQEFRKIEKTYHNLIRKRRVVAEQISQFKSEEPDRRILLRGQLMDLETKIRETKQQAVEVMLKANPGADPNDANYVFLHFVLQHLPAGLVGLVLAAIFAASMSSTASELNALASTTIVDLYQRLGRSEVGEHQLVRLSRWITVGWGVYAIIFASYASRLGTLVEAVNILGSLFYGTILGIFLVAFLTRSVTGTAVFYAALIAESAVIACFVFTKISWLWYNVVGCMLVVFLSPIFTYLTGPRFRRQASS